MENEKLRDEEIKKLIKETRLNLDKQYQEYNTFCNKYRENVLKEAKQQIKDKQKNFETAKNLIKKKYEEEIISIKKLYDDKMIKSMNEKEKEYKNKFASEKEQFRLQQELLENEITNLRNNFKKEIEILKRFKPHHIVHVPINKNNNNETTSYSAQLIQYLEQE